MGMISLTRFRRPEEYDESPAPSLEDQLAECRQRIAEKLELHTSRDNAKAECVQACATANSPDSWLNSEEEEATLRQKARSLLRVLNQWNLDIESHDSLHGNLPSLRNKEMVISASLVAAEQEQCRSKALAVGRQLIAKGREMAELQGELDRLYYDANRRWPTAYKVAEVSITAAAGLDKMGFPDGCFSRDTRNPSQASVPCVLESAQLLLARIFSDEFATTPYIKDAVERWRSEGSIVRTIGYCT